MEETEEDEANYGVLPCREAGSIPWLSTRVLVWMWFPGEQRRNAEKMRREREIWQIQQKLEYRFSITGPLRHLERLVSNGYEFLVPPRWRSDSEIKKKQPAVLLHLLFQTMESSLCFYELSFARSWSRRRNKSFAHFVLFPVVRNEQLWPELLFKSSGANQV